MLLFIKPYFWIGLYLITIVLLVTLPISEHDIISKQYIAYVKPDFIVHGLLFLPWMSWYLLKNIQLNIRVWLWFVLGVLLACGIEVFQNFLSYRSFNVNDIKASLIGLLLGTLLYAGLNSFQKRKHSKRNVK